jgi:hypothetical protein
VKLLNGFLARKKVYSPEIPTHSSPFQFPTKTIKKHQKHFQFPKNIQTHKNLKSPSIRKKNSIRKLVIVLHSIYFNFPREKNLYGQNYKKPQ